MSAVGLIAIMHILLGTWRNILAWRRSYLQRLHTRVRGRLNARRRRAAQGRMDRRTYEEQSLSRQQPWKTEGISRSTWYRRRRAAA